MKPCLTTIRGIYRGCIHSLDVSINYLKLAGILSFIAAALHVAIVIGGPDWYRFFGAGELMASKAEEGRIQPALMTLFIAFVLGVWGAYAWSGAGMLPKLPLLKIALCLVTLVYLLRGFAGLIAPLFHNSLYVDQNSTSFWVISSMICLIFGLVHLKGLITSWSAI